MNSADNPMIFETATFTFTLSGTPNGTLADTGTCAIGQLCLGNVQFGFGGDGPDEDDVTAGSVTATNDPTVPEPGSLSLLSAALVGLGLAGGRIRRMRRRAGLTIA